MTRLTTQTMTVIRDEDLPSEQAQANYNHLIWDIFWFALAVPSVARFLSVYAIRLDASPMLLGWLSALPAIIALATSSLTTWWRRRYRNTVPAQLLPGLGYRLLFLLPALTPFLPEDLQPLWLVLAVSLPALPQGVSSVTFLVLLREAVGNRQLTALTSRRSMIFNMTVAASTLAFGFWLEKAPFPVNYQIMFVISFVLTLMSSWHISRVRVPDAHPVAPAPDQAKVRPWRSPSFQQVAFIAVVMHISFFSILPIIPLRLVDQLGADEAFMSYYALAELMAAALMAGFTNRLLRRTGSRPIMAVGMIGTGLAGLILAAAPSLPITLISGALSGASWTGATISLFGFFSERTPREHVTGYSTLYNQIIMLAVFIGPMLGSQLASTSISLVTVLIAGSVLRLIAGGLIPANIIGRPRRDKSGAVAPAEG